MRVLLYEFVTGGGWHSVGADAPPSSLLAEGEAMLRAVAADLSAIPGVQVDVLHDSRYARPLDLPIASHAIRSGQQELDTLSELAAQADWTLVIAPELDGHLLARSQAVVRAGGRLLGSTLSTIALASDKHATAEHLAAHGVPVPRGVALAAGQALPADAVFPAVLKPRDGAGSQGVRLLRDARGIGGAVEKAARLEVYLPGMAASVACLCGPREVVALLPGEQLLSEDGQFRYLGGELPLAQPWAERTVQLALRAIRTLDGPRGYLGIDLVLGDDPRGDGDAVIEINPRFTTSYVGLRALAHDNLAEAMLAVAAGRGAEVSWRSRPVRFAPDGQVRTLATAGAV